MDDARAPDPSEREKWEADVRLRERELAVKEREQEIKHREVETKAQEFKRSRWTNPLVLAVLAAALAAGGNAVVALINGAAQRESNDLRTAAENKLQAEKASEERQLEDGKAEAARILEMIKTADPDKAAVNLRFLLEAGLIVEPNRREKLAAYLKDREQGKGPTLPAALAPYAGMAASAGFRSYECVLKDHESADSLSDTMLADLQPSLDANANRLAINKTRYSIDIHIVTSSGSPIADIHIGGRDNHVLVELSDASYFNLSLVPFFQVLNNVVQRSLRRLSVDPSCVTV
jgi:hypothetical protein